jgi:hypothetical protein
MAAFTVEFGPSATCIGECECDRDEPTLDERIADLNRSIEAQREGRKRYTDSYDSTISWLEEKIAKLEAEKAKQAEAKKTVGERLAEKHLFTWGSGGRVIEFRSHDRVRGCVLEVMDGCDQNATLGNIRRIFAGLIDAERSIAKAEQREADAKIADLWRQPLSHRLDIGPALDDVAHRIRNQK